MATNLSKFKSAVDKRTELLVKGFVRQCQILLPSEINFFIIPASIIQICMFYCALIEKFIVFGDHMSCDDDEQTIRMTNASVWNTAFGQIEIQYFENMVYEWIFETEKKTLVCIGIIPRQELESLKNGYIGTGGKDSCFDIFHSEGWKLKNGVCQRNDNVKFKGKCKMRLDWRENTLKLLKSDNYKNEIKYDNINVSKVYNLFVCISGQYYLTIEEFNMFVSS